MYVGEDATAAALDPISRLMIFESISSGYCSTVAYEPLSRFNRVYTRLLTATIEFYSRVHEV